MPQQLVAGNVIVYRAAPASARKAGEAALHVSGGAAVEDAEVCLLAHCYQLFLKRSGITMVAVGARGSAERGLSGSLASQPGSVAARLALCSLQVCKLRRPAFKVPGQEDKALLGALCHLCCQLGEVVADTTTRG